MKRGSLSLQVYFGSAMWVVSMLIVWAAAALFLWWTAVRTEAQVRAMAKAVASTLAVTIASEWEDTPHIETPVHLASREPGVAFVKVRFPSGSLRFSAGDPAIDPALVWVEQAQVRYFNEHLGTVEVAVFRSFGADLLRPWVQAVLLITVLATAITTLVSWRVTARMTRPLERLRSAAVRWEEPVVFDPAAYQGVRELEELAAGFMEVRHRALAKRAELETEVAVRTEELAQAYQALETSFQQTAAALAKALDARDRMTASHGNRTAELAGKIARALGMSKAEQRRLILAANLHDIGKIGVPESILLKPGPLTAEERLQMQEHAVIGAGILGEVAGMACVAEVLRHHHERWDGKGYPDGLIGEQTPYMSRILAVADAVEAMCARRRYREPMSAEEVLDELRRCSGTQFDPVIVERAWDVLVETVQEWCRDREDPGAEGGEGDPAQCGSDATSGAGRTYAWKGGG